MGGLSSTIGIGNCVGGSSGLCGCGKVGDISKRHDWLGVESTSALALIFGDALIGLDLVAIIAVADHLCWVGR